MKSEGRRPSNLLHLRLSGGCGNDPLKLVRFLHQISQLRFRYDLCFDQEFELEHGFVEFLFDDPELGDKLGARSSS